MIGETALDSLRPFSAGVQACTEGGLDFIYLPALKLTVNGKVRALDALLRPGAMDGYATRLFFSSIVPEFTRSGWVTRPILGKTWHTPSWNGIDAALPLPQMLLAHMAIYR